MQKEGSRYRGSFRCFHASIIGLFRLIIKKNALFLKKLSRFLAYVKKLLYLCPVFRVESLAIALGR